MLNLLFHLTKNTFIFEATRINKTRFILYLILIAYKVLEVDSHGY